MRERTSSSLRLLPFDSQDGKALPCTGADECGAPVSLDCASFVLQLTMRDESPHFSRLYLRDEPRPLPLLC
jgi:hypothetical protein